MPDILIIDDEVLLARSLARSLARGGHECQVAGTAEDGLRMLKTSPPDVVLLDLQLPRMSGLTALGEIAAFDSNIVVIITTGYGTVTSAVEAMRTGASDFLRKPLDLEEVSLSIERAIANARMKDTLRYFQQRDIEQSEFEFVGDSKVMREVMERIERFASFDLQRAGDCPPVLITGETGTGKDVAARLIHNRSRFSAEPFLEVNCPLLPKGLEEAELFGYERGAFTDARASKRGLFEAASGGTVFLNELGDLPAEAQAKLLQVIERKSLRHIGGLRDIEVDTRIIAATNRNLESMVAAGDFRSDLYHRLHHLTLEMPPLKDRGGDILLLARHFLARATRKYGYGDRCFTEDAEQALLAYAWPGHLRELDHTIDRAVILSKDDEITADDLNLQATTTPPHEDSDTGAQTLVLAGGDGKDMTLEGIERAAIRQALDRSGGNVSEAARMLDIGREALRYRIQKHGLNL